MTRILLIRHAEAEGNIFRRAHGHVNGLIIGRGHRQIEKLRERFANERIDAVYSSDLQRAKTTAAAIYEPRNLTLITTERLREVLMGVWEDIPWGNMEYYEPVLGRYFTTDPALWMVEGCETFAQVQERIVGCIREIAESHDGETVAVFSHGYSIRAFMCAILGVASNESMKVPYCDNTAVALLLYNDGAFTVEYQGDNSHLDSETSTFAKQTWWRNDKEMIRENIRIEPYDEVRDKALLETCGEGDALRRFTETGAGKVYTAVYEEKTIGLICLDTERDGDERVGWIGHIYIRAEYQRKGFGVQLLGQAVSDFRSLGREKLRSEAAGDSSVHGFCLKYGFESVEKIGAYDILEKSIKNW